MAERMQNLKTIKKNRNNPLVLKAKKDHGN